MKLIAQGLGARSEAKYNGASVQALDQATAATHKQSIGVKFGRSRRAALPYSDRPVAAGGRLTIGCRGCGALHDFGWMKVLCAGPAPLILAALGRWAKHRGSRRLSIPAAPHP
jgi:hypothetical protein